MFRIAVIFIAALSILPGSAQGDTASQVVTDFQAKLSAVMKEAEKLGYQGRYEQLAPEIEASHDLPAITRVATGRYWRKFNDAQRTLLVDIFSELSVATYAAKFDGYSGETFRTISERQSDADNAVVNTLLHSGDEKIRLDYMLRRRDGRWRIVNIVTEGVSDLALKRATYTSTLRREGFEVLIDKLREQIAELSNPGT